MVKYTEREKIVLKVCPIEKINIDYHSPFRGKSKEWKEIKLDESEKYVTNPEVCKNVDQLHFRRSTLGHRWRAYAHKKD